MKNKLISFIIIFSFSACLLCTPVHIFLQSFCKSAISFKKIDVKSIPKNIVLFAGKVAQFDDFTQNIKTPSNKVFDFAGVPALFSKTGKQKIILTAYPDNVNFFSQFAVLDAFYFEDSDRHRLRTCGDAGKVCLFIFFILIYIGMLRVVYSHKNILLLNIKKPLFA
ncbi:MAG: hypothetical protein LBL00_05400 [Endomicrobium sp.]|jgi:hypothetical protein|nr:hypothetical protein [Endomicrobium sp.]